MTDQPPGSTSFKCECGQTFPSRDKLRDHQKTHPQKTQSDRAGTGTQKSTATGQQQGETAPGNNQKGREESQQGWRQPSGHDGTSDGQLGNSQDGREAKNLPDGGSEQVTQVGDAHEWKHGKQENDTQDEMADDWGKSDKH